MLNKRQLRFVEEYCVDLNAAQACIRAGYSKHTARTIGEQNMRKPHIKAEIDKRLNAKSQEINITAKMVLDGIMEIAFKSDAKDTDRLRALELLGKYLKLFTDKIEQETRITTNEPIKVVFDDKMKDWAN